MAPLPPRCQSTTNFVIGYDQRRSPALWDFSRTGRLLGEHRDQEHKEEREDRRAHPNRLRARTPDRVPFHCWLGLPLIKKLREPDQSFLDLFEDWIDDPMGSIVKMQQDVGLDPMITTYSQHIGEHEIWPRMLFPRPFETDTWVETFEETDRGTAGATTTTIRTPDGDLDYSYRTEDGFGTSCHDFLLKGDEPEQKLPALRHFPSADLYDMTVLKGMVEKVGDEAWWLHHVIGPGTWRPRSAASSTCRWTSTTGRSSCTT